MLSPVGKFGKFLVVLLSLSIIANIAPTTYSIGMELQTVIPPLLSLPRYVIPVIATAV
jgi:purine-cytosine permease-like protein